MQTFDFVSLANVGLSTLLMVLSAFVGYLLLLAVAASRSPLRLDFGHRKPSSRFAILIPAHDEASVIADTVTNLLNVHYPEDLYKIHVIADHCADNTAAVARMAGALAHERNEGPRTGKGAALSWGLERVLGENIYDAAIVFDADTKVDPDFLRAMDARLTRGDLVIQGQHIISNPDRGWFPALTWAMFMVDNRLQNLGRSNLGWSAKNMGDSICFSSQVLRNSGWGAGLTEDYQLRHRLLIRGIKIAYEPMAKGYGEAPLSWEQARAQRSRWLRGTRDASQQFAHRLLIEGIKRCEGALIDGALQAYFPSYSTLTLISMMVLTVQLVVKWKIHSAFPPTLIAAWATLLGLLFLYPLFGLALEGAPFRAYLAILSGPFYIFWRTWLAFSSRLRGKQVPWIRTAHGG